MGHRYVCGPMCPTVGCHPAIDQWQVLASTASSDVDSWWGSRPFSVLLATGRTFDVIEVPAGLGRAATRGAAPGPVAVTPTGRWMFFTSAGDSLRPELDGRLDVVLHGYGSWVPAPPTRTPEGRIRWEISPAMAGWQLPQAYAVQEILLAQARPRTATFASTTPRLGRAT
jgi:Bifunctional DNA primase/polymerase, N-terminal